MLQYLISYPSLHVREYPRIDSGGKRLYPTRTAAKEVYEQYKMSEFSWLNKRVASALMHEF